MDSRPEVRAVVLEWFAFGEVGASSRTLAYWIIGEIRNMELRSRPLDKDDCRRCALLVKSIEGFGIHWQSIANLNPDWEKWIPEIEEQVKNGPLTRNQANVIWSDDHGWYVSPEDRARAFPLLPTRTGHAPGSG